MAKRVARRTSDRAARGATGTSRARDARKPKVGVKPKPTLSAKPKPKGGAKPKPMPKGGAKPKPKGGAKPKPKGGAKPKPTLSAKPKPKGYALLIGLTQVSPLAYGGWLGREGCAGCERDVDAVHGILRPLGYTVKKLKTAKAKRKAILDGVRALATKAKSGDVALVYYSGHGGQQPDANGDEKDGKDETLVAYDGELVDDALHKALKTFKKGVRVVMMSDSCNSGTNYKGLRPIVKSTVWKPVDAKAGTSDGLKAMLIHFGGCRDGYTSSGYELGGAFTTALVDTWSGGAFEGTLKSLHQQIVKRLKASGEAQNATYTEHGAVTPAFKKQRAFAIA